MSELTSMQNIGKEMEKKLKSINICSTEELSHIGSKDTFLRLKTTYTNLCLVHLYTLQGAIDNLPYNQLSDGVKLDLKNFNDSLR